MLCLTACSSTEKSQIDSSKDAKAQGKNNVQTILFGTGTQFLIFASLMIRGI